MENKEISVFIEIPFGSSIKYEWNRRKKQIEVDRILRQGFKYPCNYGFVKEALDWDGDELDVLIYSKNKFLPGSKLNVRIVGAMKMIDDGEIDTKLIGVHSDDYTLSKINNIQDINKKWLKKVEKFFSTYKNWKRKGITIISGFENKTWAINEYKECVSLMKKYGKLPKEEFIAKMKKEFPKKYI